MLLWCLYYAGYIDVYVGGQQPNQATTVDSNVLHGDIHVTPSAGDDDTHSRMRVDRGQPLDHDTRITL